MYSTSVDSFIPPEAPFGIACHDAGGANQIAAMVRRYGWVPDCALICGPAKAIWDDWFPESPTTTDLAAVKNLRTIITGTGWASDFEHQARAIARSSAVRTIAVLDHWVNYIERFERYSIRVWPDEVWVVDQYAEHLAKRLLPTLMIRRVEDCYLEHQLSQIKPIDETTSQTLLYLTEPMRNDWARGRPGEMQAIEYFMTRLPELNLPKTLSVELRLHPSEEPNKYDALLNLPLSAQITIVGGRMADSISRSRWVAGCQTYALTVALAAKRRVFCSLPPWAPPCVLPHKGIECI